MATKIESTVQEAAAVLAKMGLPGDRPVTVVVHDTEDDARFAELRAAIDEGDASEDIEGPDAMAMLRATLVRNLSPSS